MNEFKDAIKEDFGADLADEFIRRACYYPKIDCIEYVSEDTTVVCDRIDDYLTLLWDESLANLVGFKLKGFRYVFNSIIKPISEINHEDFNRIIKPLEVLFTKIGDGMFPDKRKDAYREVIDFIRKEDVRLSDDIETELAKAA